jgi:aspartyl-tRNA(Asn)/glutamyl-tRNA(Gln) amidotransferase subunit B
MVSDKTLAEYFEAAAAESGNANAAANWVLGELTRELNNSGKSANESPVSPKELGELIKLVESGKINNNKAKETMVEMFASGRTAAEVIAEKGFEQISDSSEIEKIVDDIIANNQNQVDAFRSGKDALIGFFVGQVMKASGGKANPKLVNEILRDKLHE